MSALYRCPPLRAFLSEAQCAYNATLARRAARSSPGSEAFVRGMVVRDCCPTCPGVVALGAGTRDLPEIRVVCHPTKRRRRQSSLTGMGKRIGISAATAAATRWTCPPHLTSVSALSNQLHLAPSVVKRRLERARLRAAERADPRIGRPTLYDKAQAEEALR